MREIYLVKWTPGPDFPMPDGVKGLRFLRCQANGVHNQKHNFCMFFSVPEMDSNHLFCFDPRGVNTVTRVYMVEVEASLVKSLVKSLDFTDDQSTLVQVMAWCHQATSLYLSQCWSKSMSPYGVTRPQWVNTWMKETMNDQNAIV